MPCGFVRQQHEACRLRVECRGTCFTAKRTISSIQCVVDRGSGCQFVITAAVAQGLFQISFHSRRCIWCRMLFYKIAQLRKNVRNPKRNSIFVFMKNVLISFSELGARLRRFGDDNATRGVVDAACRANGWFTLADVRRAVGAIAGYAEP